jgi:hypothetical protein
MRTVRLTAEFFEMNLESNMKRLRDITADIGPLYNIGAPTIPMYSFNRPATILWQAVYDAMRAAGRTDAQATEWLQSKAPRWMLDAELGDKLQALGEEIGQRAAAAGVDA